MLKSLKHLANTPAFLMSAVLPWTLTEHFCIWNQRYEKWDLLSALQTAWDDRQANTGKHSKTDVCTWCLGEDGSELVPFLGGGRGQAGRGRSCSYWNLIFSVIYNVMSSYISDKESGGVRHLWRWFGITIMELWAGAEERHGMKRQATRRQSWVCLQVLLAT